MKYLFVIPTLLHGGAERVVSVISSALADAGKEVVVVKYYEEDGEYKVSDKVHTISLVTGGRDAYLKLGKFGLLRALRAVIRKERPDFVIPFMFQVALLTEMATIGLKTITIQSIRIDPASGPASKWKRCLRDYLVYHSKCTFVQNIKQKDYFNEKYHDKIHVLFNPVSDDLFEVTSEKKQNRFLFCGMGRLTEQKNFNLLIESFSETFSNVEEVFLEIYGEGELHEVLQKKIESLGMQSKIQLMGRTNDIKSVYKFTNCFVLSSNCEGMPNALIEAMACGVPSIATDCPTGPNELIDDFKNGILVPVGDKEQMSLAMERMYHMSEDKLDCLGIEGRKKIIAKCSRDKIAQEMIKICEALVK